MSRVSVTFDGNSVGAVGAARQTVEAIDKVKRTVAEQAQQGIQKRIEERRSLQALAAEYTRVATTAKRGSEVQVSALKLEQRTLRELADQHGVYNRRLQSSTKEIERFSKGAILGSGALGHMGRTAALASGAFLGGVGVIQVFKDATHGGEELQTQLIRTTKTFGDQAAGIKAWSKDSVASLLLSRSAALDAANTFGTLLANMGVAPAKVAPMSKSLVQLAADMAAFKGVDVTVALSALEAAVAGRTRGLKQLGVAIDATAVKQEAEREGLAKNIVDLGKVANASEQVRIAEYKLGVAVQKHGAQSVEAAQATITLHHAQDAAKKAAAGHAEALTNEQKALATYNLILAQTGKQQGYVSTHTDTLAVQSAKLKAEEKELFEILGTGLIPLLIKYLPHLTAWIDKNEKNGTFQRDFNAALKTGGEVINGVIPVVKEAAKVWGHLADAVGGNAHAIELLLGYFAGKKLIGGLNALTVAAGEEGAAGAVGLLRSRLLLLSKLGVITVAVEVLIHKKEIGGALGGIEKWITDATSGGLTDKLAKIEAAALNKIPGVHVKWQDLTKPVAGYEEPGQGGGKTGSTTQTHTTSTGPGSGAASDVGGGFIPQGQSYVEKRSDQGRDLQTNPGGNIIAPGDGAVIAILHNPGRGGSAFGNDYPVVEFKTGPYKGMGPLYLGHVIPDRSVGSFKKGDILGHTASAAEAQKNINGGAPPGWAEIGFAPGGSPGPTGQPTPFGKDSGTPGTTTTTTTGDTTGGTGGTFVEKPGKPKKHADPIASYRVALKTGIAQINDDVDKGLLPQSIGDRLEARAAAIQKSLEHATKADIPKIRTQMRDLNAAVSTALRATRDQALLGRDEKQIHTDVKDGLLSKSVGDSLIAQAKAINARLVRDIFDPKKSAADDAAARGFRARIAAMLSQAAEVRTIDADMSKMKTDWAQQLDNALGIPVVHATAGAVAKAKAGIAKIRAEFASNKVIPAAERTKLKQQLATYEATVADGMQGVIDAVTAKRSRFESAWSKLASATFSAFDKETARHLSKMQEDAKKAIDAIQVTVSGSGFASFLFGGPGAQTPSEILRAQRAAAKQKADDISSIADATKQLADAQAALAAYGGGTAGAAGHDPYSLPGGDTVTGYGTAGSSDLASLQQAVVDAQKALDDAKYQQESDDLDAQAQLERDAADKQLADAQDAAQKAADQQQQDYQDQRDAQRQHIQDMFDDELQAILEGKKTLAQAMAELGGLLGQNLAAAFAAWFDPSNPDSVTSTLAGFLYQVELAKGKTPSQAAVAALSSLPPSESAFGASPGVDYTTGFDANGIPIAPAGGWGGTGSSSPRRSGFARGGWASQGRPVVDARDTIPAMLRRGEYVMSPDEVAAGGPSWARGGGGTHFHGDLYVIGTTKREVQQAIAEMASNGQERQIGYMSPRG